MDQTGGGTRIARAGVIYSSSVGGLRERASGSGLMNHFWATCDAECEGALLVRYYIDGEENASIAFEPGMAAGSSVLGAVQSG